MVTIFVHGYAIFLCYADYDYQDEKPKDEKSPIDELIKDLKHSEFWFLIHSFLVQFISLFTPPITSYFVYSIVHVGVFLANFYLMSLFVLLYVHYIFTFYPDQSANIDIRSLRWKTLLWKFFLTILSLLLSFLVPIEEMPMPFQMFLTKGKQCDR